MKKHIVQALAMALVLCSMICACSDTGTSTKVTASDESAITLLRLGTLRRTVTIKKAGTDRDTTFVTTLVGGYYPMLIDQLNHRIYNPDSLPMGTDATHIMFSNISADGLVTYRTDWGTDTIVSSTDTIDFTKPRIFTCYARSGNGKQEYTVYVNVHKVNPTDFTWTKLNVNDNIKGMTAQRAFVLDSTVYVYGLTNAGNFVLLSTKTKDGYTWAQTDLSGKGITLSDIQCFNGAFYAIVNGTIVVSENGVDWETAGADIAPDRLMGAGISEIYALRNGALYSSKDARAWFPDAIDADQSLLPVAETTSAGMPMTFNDKFEYALICGKDATGEPCVWKKVFDRRTTENEGWSYYPQSEEIGHPYPACKSMNVAPYNDILIAIGCQADSISPLYVSEDGGRNWKANVENYVRPNDITGNNVSMTVDEEHFIWIICGGSGQIWRGRMNQLAFDNEQRIFTE